MSFSFKSMWKYKCPRCRQGDLFIKPLKLSDPLAMPKQCQHCGQKTEPEPGFYFGAMYISYIFMSGFILVPTLLLVFLLGWSVEGAMVFAIALMAVSYFRFARGARAFYIHMVIKFDPEASDPIRPV